MDVRLPDGHIIRNVPDGMSKADLTAKLQSNGYDVSNLGGAGASGAGASAREIPTTYNGDLAPRDEYTPIVPPEAQVLQGQVRPRWKYSVRPTMERVRPPLRHGVSISISAGRRVRPKAHPC